MPPKPAASKKNQEKVKTKVIEDKTFGLKNKKGAKQQKFIAVVTKQVQAPKDPRAPDPNAERQKKLDAEKAKKEELKELFKPVVQTVAKGVDPKSVVCVYFKQGSCTKGDRCKFSHDLAVERKAEKRNIYEDVRENDSMDTWDQDKLEDVINEKHGDDNKNKATTTEIVCKFFIEAVEKATYGWFWACPNGSKCMYRHALPPGFQLKSDIKNAEDKKDQISIEMLVEKERSALGRNVTPITLDSFLAWKKRKIQDKIKEKKQQEDKKANEFKRGNMMGITGRDLFTFNPDLIANDDDEAGDDIDYSKRVYDEIEEDEGQDGDTPRVPKVHMREINSEFFSTARDVDGSGTMATEDRFAYMGKSSAHTQSQDDKENHNSGKGDSNDDIPENDHLNSIKALIEPKKMSSKKEAASSNKLEIDESLFNLDDLDDIEDELEELDI